jgi:hypothetical protein
MIIQAHDKAREYMLCGCVVWWGVVWCVLIQCVVIWYGGVWCGVIWCSVVWYSIVLYEECDVKWCDKMCDMMWLHEMIGGRKRGHVTMIGPL